MDDEFIQFPKPLSSMVFSGLSEFAGLEFSVADKTFVFIPDGVVLVPKRRIP